MKRSASPLGDLLSGIETGVNFNPVTDNASAGQWRVLKISAVTSGEFDPFESKPISLTEVIRPEFIVHSGDLLMSRANTTELVGAVARVRQAPPPVVLPDKLWRLRIRDDAPVDAEYLLMALRTWRVRRLIETWASGTSLDFRAP
jgi:type I restriction enzyme S subunit